MSFSYKTLSSNDITLTSYIANKQWEVTNTTLSQNGVTIYIGENLPISRTYPFDPINDLQTSNDEYRRLVFDSIKHLFFENYTSGSLTGEFFHSSSYFNYEQNTLASGSGVSTFRRISTTTGSNIPVLYDTDDLYDNNAVFDSDRGGKVIIVSIDQNVYGSGLNPNSVFISGSGYYLRDDGEGNLYNWRNEGNYAKYATAIYDKDVYLELVGSGLQLEYVGNVFYSHGLIVITDDDYLCVFGAPPSAVNDYFSYFNMNTPGALDVLGNDICDCGTLNYNSFATSSIEGFTFPNFTYNNGLIDITQDQTSVIPGNYSIGYTILNSSGLISNTGSVNLIITSQPLIIQNIISSSVCFGTASLLPVTFSINYGVPYYSYSLDNGATYTGVNKLFNVTVSGSISSSLNNTIYVKDYLGDIVTASFSTMLPTITSDTVITKLPCSNISTDGIITVSSSTATSASIDSGPYFILPTQFTGLSTGSHTIIYKNNFGCTTSSIFTLPQYTPLTASVTMSHVNCYGSSTGQININLSNVIDNLYLSFINPTGSYVLNNVPITSSNLVFSNLATGSWTASLSASNLYGCQNYYNTFNITSSAPITFTTTASYLSSCSNAITFNASGGLGGYTYFAQETDTGQSFQSTNSTILTLSLNGGNFTVYVQDTGSCISSFKTQEIYGRQYVYSGSYCETGSAPTTTTTTIPPTTTSTTTLPPFEGYTYIMSDNGYYNSSTACSFPETFETVYRDEPTLFIGDIIYNDEECTAPKTDGDNLWWYITDIFSSTNQSIQINSSGVISGIFTCTTPKPNTSNLTLTSASQSP
jgi:hypothetical protein